MILTLALAQLPCKMPGNAHMDGGSGPSWAAASPLTLSLHSHSYAAILEVLYGVSWVTKGCWQPIWRA